MVSTADRISEYAVCSSVNIYVELRDREDERQNASSEKIAKYEQLARIHRGILTYLSDLQSEHKDSYDRHPEDTSHVFRTIGEDYCVIGDMPGWRLPWDASLNHQVHFAIGADGALYATRTLSSFKNPDQDEFRHLYDEFLRKRNPLSRDNYLLISDSVLMTYEIGQLEQIGDAIEAYIAKSPHKILALMTTRVERSRVETS